MPEQNIYKVVNKSEDSNLVRLAIPFPQTPLLVAPNFLEPGTYENVKAQARAKNLVVPTFSQTAFIALAGFENLDLGINYESEQARVLYKVFAKKVEDAMRGNGFRTSTLPVYLETGFLAVDDIPENAGKQISSFQQLEEILVSSENGVGYSEDRSIRYTDYGYKLGELSISELAKHRLILALAGGEPGAEPLVKIVEFYKKRTGIFPHLEAMNSEDPRKTFSSIGGGDRLLIRGWGFTGYWAGISFALDKD